MAFDDFVGVSFEELNSSLVERGLWGLWRADGRLARFGSPVEARAVCRSRAAGDEADRVLAALWDVAAGGACGGGEAAQVVCHLMEPAIRALAGGVRRQEYGDTLTTLVGTVWMRVRQPRPASWSRIGANLSWELRKTLRGGGAVLAEGDARWRADLGLEERDDRVELPVAARGQGGGAGTSSAELLELLAWAVREGVVDRGVALTIVEIVDAGCGRWSRAAQAEAVEAIAARSGVTTRTARRRVQAAVAALSAGAEGFLDGCRLDDLMQAA